MAVIDTIKCDGASNAIVMPQPFKISFVFIKHNGKAADL